MKSVREQKGVQLIDVQTQTGIDLSQLSRIENGKRLPTAEQLNELSSLYGIDCTAMQIQRQSDKIITTLEHPEYGLESLAIAREKILHGDDYVSMFCEMHFSKPICLSSRRYIGSKAKLLDWIFEIIDANTESINTFCDIFAGTGVVANVALSRYPHVIMNDLLFSNNVIYKAFFAPGEWDKEKVAVYLSRYNSLNPDTLRENYFSKNFGGKFFEASEAKRIGYIRQDIENHKKNLTEKEYNVLLATLIYNIDKIANTIGHFEAYIRKPIAHRPLCLKMIDAKELQNVEIFREDSNKLAKRVHCDVVYIDPPYYSMLSDNEYVRRYHFVEGLARDWKGVEIQQHTQTKKFKSYPTPFSTRKGAADAFDLLFKRFADSILLVSYSSNSLPTQDEMLSIMAKHKAHVEVIPIDYQYSFGNQGDAATRRNKVQEYLFVGY